MIERPLTLGELLAAAAHRYPDKPAIIFKNTRITYAELRRRADAYLMIAHDLGVRLKDKYEVKKLDDDFFEEL